MMLASPIGLSFQAL